MSYRFCLGSLMTLGLVCACTPVMQASMDSINLAIRGPAPLNISQAQLDTLPYRLMKLETNSFGSAIMYLARTNAKQNIWGTTTEQVIVEEGGLVRRVTGFPTTIESTRFIGTDPFANGMRNLHGAITTQRIVDWMPGFRYGIIINSIFRPYGATSVRIQDKSRDALLVEETFQAENIDFSGINRYWISPVTGTVLMSEQQLTPDLRVTLQLLATQYSGAVL